MKEPIKTILSRDVENKELYDILAEVVNFGTHILNWELENRDLYDEDVPVIMMFRNILELLDSISILIKHSSIDPCKLLLRGLLETFLQLEYLLEKETKTRALTFIVWNTHKEIKSLTKMNPKEETYQQLNKTLQKDKLYPDNYRFPIHPDIEKELQNSNELLKLPSYVETEAKYQYLVKNGKKNPNWYQIDNPKLEDIEKLAAYLKRTSFYEMIYRIYSHSIHGTDILRGKINGEGIVALRFPKDAALITLEIINVSLSAYKTMIDKRLPHHQNENKQWYLTIRDRYLQLIKNN